MSQVRTGTGFAALIALAAALLLAGCSDPNTQAKIFDPDTGKHPDGWATSHGSSYVTYQNVCHDCHGTDFKGGISSVGCFMNAACHSGVTSCGTCHGDPPNGTMFPNIAGAHAVHIALNVALTCNDCHTGAGSGTALHMNYVANVNLSNTILTTFKASSGNVSYNAGSATCSKISCHGGIATPNWIAGSIDVNSQCGSCHTFGSFQNPEYNSFWSGEHDKHVNGEGIGCTSCHDPARLATSHFTNLQTTTMEGPASQTIYLSIQYNGTTCNNPCHEPKNW